MVNQQENKEWEEICRAAVLEWMIITMSEWSGPAYRYGGKPTYDLTDWIEMLQAEAPDVFIAMLQRSEKFLEVEDGSRITAT